MIAHDPLNTQPVLPSAPVASVLWKAVMGSQQFSIPEQIIVGIEQPSQIYPIPRTESPFLGVISYADDFLPHFDSRSSQAPPAYFVVLETLEGRLSIATDHIRPLAGEDPSSVSENLDPLPWTTLLSGFHALKTATSTVKPSPSARQFLLLVRVGKTLCALDPDEVISIERHQLQHPLHGMKHSAERLVTLQEGTIVRGLSLVRALEHDDADAWGESWTILMKDRASEERVAVLVEAVLGIESVQERDISTVIVNRKLSTWFSHPEYGNIEWLEIQRWISTHPDQVSRKNYGSQTSTLDLSQTSESASDEYGWPCSSSMMVLPREMLASIGRVIHPQDLSPDDSEGRQAIFDLGVLLDTASEPTLQESPSGRLLLMRLPHHPEIALLVPTICAISSQDGELWSPLPLVPYSIRRLITAARVVDQQIHYRLDPQLLFERLSLAFKEHSLSRAFLGFIEIDLPIHQTFD